MAVGHTEDSVMASTMFFFFCLWVMLLPTDAVTSAGGRVDWHILSARNYSSQISLHPYALVFVTVPWSGETRSLMRDLSHELANNQDELGSLKLMVVYRNQNNALADSLGATEGITVLCYAHGVSYKYQGRLTMRDILHSMSYLMSLVADALPFEEIRNSDDLDKFLASTDNAVLLVESCEWTSKILARHSHNRTAEGTSVDGNDIPRDIREEVNQAMESGALENQEAMGSEELKCDAVQGFGAVPWIPNFTGDNGTSFYVDHNEKNLSAGSSCSTDEYQKFSSFLSKFISMTRNIFLPPQRQRFGRVSERSLLSSLASEDLDTWSLVIYNSAFPNSSKIVKNEKDLQVALEIQNFSIMELTGDGLDDGPALPLHKPSVILFVDRLANSSDIGRKSKDAFQAFKEAAVMHNASYQTNTYKADSPKKLSTRTYQRSRIVSQYSRTQHSAPSENFKEKMSVMVVKDGKRVTLDSVGSGSLGHSLQEILTHMLGENKQKTLSSVAKEVGFQLLSDDLDITMTDEPPTRRVDLTSFEPPKERSVEREAVKEKDHDLGYSSASDGHQQSDMKNSEPSNNQSKESALVNPLSADSEFVSSDSALEVDKSPVAKDEQVLSIKKDLNLGSSSVSDNNQQPEVFNNEPSTYLNKVILKIPVSVDPKFSSSDTYSEDKAFPQASDVPAGLTYEEEEELVKQPHEFKDSSASFFFSDGNYQLVSSLTGESKVPRLVIVDPFSQLHYVIPESKSLSHSSIEDAIDRFFKGSLSPYQRSGPLEGSKEFPHPPFVNLDFHEKYSIPSVTTNTFTGLVLGSKRFNAQNASNPWNSDVLVLFTNSWCGFCQRMELVVREVYRSLKSSMNQEKGASKDGKLMLANENLNAIILELPVIYRIDCTLNDCSLILKTFNQRELYPSLLLFPAKRKNALLYDCDVAVNDIIRFIATHGSTSFQQVREKDDIKTTKSFSSEGTVLSARQELLNSKEDSHAVILKEDRVGYRKPVRLHWKKSFISKPPDVATQFEVTVGSFLIATEILGSLSPFSNGKILIVSADQTSGFLGLMINKYLTWDTLPELSLSDRVKQAPLSFGGPVVQGESPLVALTKAVLFRHEYPEVLPGIYFLDQSAASEVIRQLDSGEDSGSVNVSDFWFFLGYSGWGWHQLFDEISQGAWSLDDRNDSLDWPWKSP